MAASPNLHDILIQAKQLGKEDQLTLIQRLAVLLKRPEVAAAAPAGLTTLAGLGSELWQSAGAIDRYLDEERQW